MTISANRRQVWRTATALATAALALGGCSGSGKPATSATSGAATATGSPSDQQAPPGLPTDRTDIARVWEQFFDAGTPTTVKQQLVQNGTTLTAAINAFTTDPATSRATAQVTRVTVDSATEATVTYNVLSMGKTRQAGVTGKAVHVNGVWKVSATTLCALVKPAGRAGLPGCPGGS